MYVAGLHHFPTLIALIKRPDDYLTVVSLVSNRHPPKRGDMSVHGDLSVTAPDQASITKGPEVHSEEADFGGELGLPEAPELTEAQEKKLWRKVDLRLMPILSLMYLMSFLDRGKQRVCTLKQTASFLTPLQEILVGISCPHFAVRECLLVSSAGNAKLQGLTTQLDLTGNKYNIALVSIYYCVELVFPVLTTRIIADHVLHRMWISLYSCASVTHAEYQSHTVYLSALRSKVNFSLRLFAY